MIKEQIAVERIKKLFNLAENVFSKDENLAKRYVFLARKIASKCRVRIPREFKRSFCKNCGVYFKQGVNCRVRLNKKKLIVYYCLNCKHIRRFKYK